MEIVISVDAQMSMESLLSVIESKVSGIPIQKIGQFTIIQYFGHRRNRMRVDLRDKKPPGGDPKKSHSNPFLPCSDDLLRIYCDESSSTSLASRSVEDWPTYRFVVVMFL